MSELISLKRLKNTSTEDFYFVRSLLQESFPFDEYRDLDEWASFTQNQSLFHNNIIQSGTNRVGMLSYWNFSSFIYIEHFAIAPQFRGNGMGHVTLKNFINKMESPIVLEVEKPKNPIAKRRIDFYARLNFKVLPFSYVQPPYRQGGKSIPLLMMSNKPLWNEAEYQEVKTRIYQSVYSYDIGMD